MINLKLLTKGLRGALSPSEFITLFVIESALGKTNDWKKIYYDMMADLTGLSSRQVKRNVDSLVEKGFVKRKTKQLSKTKRESLYCLNLDKLNTKTDEIDDEFVTKTNTSLDTGVILNNIKQLKTNKNNIKQIEKDFINEGLKYENPSDGFSTYPSDEKEMLFDEYCSVDCKPIECYRAFAERGQDAFNWLCNKIHFNKDFYRGTTDVRNKVAIEFGLTIPTSY